MHRVLVIVVNDAAFPILALVRGLCPSLALSFARGRGAWRLCQLYALITTTITKASYHVSTHPNLREDKGEGEGLGITYIIYYNSQHGSKSQAPGRP